VDVLYRYILKIGETSRAYAELYGRSAPNLLDLAQTFQRLGVRVADLEEFAAHFELAAARPLPRYPAPARDELNFMKPGSREVLHRPMHIPDHLPPMYPEMEEEEEEGGSNGISSNGGGRVTPSASADGAEEGGGGSLQSTPGAGRGRKEGGAAGGGGGGSDQPGGGSEESSTFLREISSVMMTSSGFLSPCREGKMADSKTPHIVPEPEEKRPAPPPPTAPAPPAAATTTPQLPGSAAAALPSVKRQLEPGSGVAFGGMATDKRPKMVTGEDIFPLWVKFVVVQNELGNTSDRQIGTVKSPNFVTAHYFFTAAENFCEALIGF
jgi:hypothetical protein